MARVNVTIPDGLLEKIDAISAEDYATRSEVIRQAVLFYMRFTASTLSKADAELLLKAIKSRQLQAYLNKAVKHRGKKSF